MESRSNGGRALAGCGVAASGDVVRCVPIASARMRTRAQVIQWNGGGPNGVLCLHGDEGGLASGSCCINKENVY